MNDCLRLSRPVALGLGCGALGSPALDDDGAVRLVHAALDLGVTLFDSARSYGASEVRLGRALSMARARDVCVSTKGGYGVDGVADWTYDAVARGVDEACGRLGVERVGVFHLHSCPREVLERDDRAVVRALDDAVRAGKVARAGYAGDGAALACALADARFNAFELTLNVLDRANSAHLAAGDRALDVVIAKRALANAPWRTTTDADPALAEYARRWRLVTGAAAPDAGAGADGAYGAYGAYGACGADGADGVDGAEDADGADGVFLRWAAHQPGVTHVLVGTTSVAHLERAAAQLARGSLPADIARVLDDAWRAVGAAWPPVT